MSESYVIRRESAELGKPGQVYVTDIAYLIGCGGFSSTRIAADATRFTEAQARRLCAEHWRHLDPTMVPVNEATDLPEVPR